MNRPRRAFARPTAVSLFLTQAVLLLLAVAPRMVWCHKPSGESEIELEAAPGECRCRECPLCRERDSEPPDGARTRQPSLHAAHCRHDEIKSEAVRSTGLSPLKSGAIAPAPAVVPRPPEAPTACVSPAAVAPLSRDMDAGPPGAALRC